MKPQRSSFATASLIVSGGARPYFLTGGAGLVTTVDDYVAFGQMLLNKGTYRRLRVLSRPSVELMTTDHLTPAQKATSGFFAGQWDNRGWGFGVCIVTGRDNVWAVPGRFGWDGGYGTSWASDPKEDMVAVLMTQRAEFPSFSSICLDFWTSVYRAIDERVFAGRSMSSVSRNSAWFVCVDAAILQRSGVANGH